MEPIQIEMSLYEIITLKSYLRTTAEGIEKFIESFGDPYGVNADSLANINSVIEKLSRVI